MRGIAKRSPMRPSCGKNKREGRTGQKERVDEEAGLWYGQMKGHARAKAGCSEPYTAYCLAAKAENSSDSDRPSVVDAHVAYSSKNAQTEVIEATSCTKWHEYSTAN